MAKCFLSDNDICYLTQKPYHEVSLGNDANCEECPIEKIFGGGE